MSVVSSPKADNEGWQEKKLKKAITTITFRLGFPKDSELKDSLTMQPPKSMHQLMRRIEEYKRLVDDHL